MAPITAKPAEIMPTVNDPLAEVITGPAPVTVTTQGETGPDPSINRLAGFSSYVKGQRLPGLDTIEGRWVTIMGCKFLPGKFGTYAILTLTDPDGVITKVATGGTFVIEALQKAEAAQAWPCVAQFVKDGRCWTVQ